MKRREIRIENPPGEVILDYEIIRVENRFSVKIDGRKFFRPFLVRRVAVYVKLLTDKGIWIREISQ